MITETGRIIMRDLCWPPLTIKLLVSTEEVTEKEVESWSDPTTGFESLMSSPAAREIFRKYLTGEFSAENLIFWTACNDLKSIKKREMFKEKVEKIFQNHLDISSQHEVIFIYFLPHQSLT